jgi:DNA-binding NtrC family response regulator
MDTVVTRPILAISATWQTRALIAAQVGETTGHDVVSAPGVNEALALVRITGSDPVLTVVDAGQQMSPEEVERLMTALPDTPLVLSVSALRRAAFDPLRDRCAAYLIRPVSIGRIAQAAAQVLSASTTDAPPRRSAASR